MTASIEDWTYYWHQFQGPPGACLPMVGPGVEQALQAYWRSFASSLPKGSHVVDLACGSGSVGKYMRSFRPDCTFVGVDSANINATEDMVIHCGVSIEEMPFADKFFDAAVSQFGFEYADAGRAARELGRVLRGGAEVGMVLHHARGPIVAHNLERDEALGAISGNVIGQAFLRGERTALAKAFSHLALQFERQDIVAEFSSGLQSAVNFPEADRAELWQGLLGKIKIERSIIGSLKSAAVKDLEGWAAIFDDAFTRRTQETISDAGGEPFAWTLNVTRN